MTVFNPDERVTMIKEYFYPEDEEKWEAYVDMQESDRDYLNEFKDENLLTFDSQGVDVIKNRSEGSLILAPRNSSINTDDAMDFRSEVLTYFQEKDDMLYFKTKIAHMADLRYEQDHNEYKDNGVYQDVKIDNNYLTR